MKNEDKVFEVSVKKVDSIMITTSAYLSTDAIKFAIENNIDVIFSMNSATHTAGYGIQNLAALF